MKTPSMLVLLAVAAALAATGPSFAREVRGAARTSVNQNHNANVNQNRNVNVNQNNNVNVNRNVNRNVDVNVDVDRNYHPWATAAAVTTAAVVTGAVIGSMVRSVPPNCQTVIVNGVSYSQCGSTWYQPQMQGSSVTYVVVEQPH